MEKVSELTNIVYCPGGMFHVKIIVSSVFGTCMYDPNLLDWKDYPDNPSVKYLTLASIKHQIMDGAIITVWQDTALWGKIYQFGNWDNTHWYRIGDTCGFA